MTRRLLPFLIAAIVLLALTAACSGDDDDKPGSTTSAAFATNASSASNTVAAGTPASSSNCPAPSGDAPEPNMKTYSAAPPNTIDASKTYIATVKTVRGDFKIKLRPDLAPQHVNSFVFLAKEGYFDGVTFHRVLPGFVAQTGDPTGTGSRRPRLHDPGRVQRTPRSIARGTVGMARTTDPNSAGSQWFITYGDTPNLDGQYTIFGEVTEGMDVVDCITAARSQPRTRALLLATRSSRSQSTRDNQPGRSKDLQLRGVST